MAAAERGRQPAMQVRVLLAAVAIASVIPVVGCQRRESAGQTRSNTTGRAPVEGDDLRRDMSAYFRDVNSTIRKNTRGQRPPRHTHDALEAEAAEILEQMRAPTDR